MTHWTNPWEAAVSVPLEDLAGALEGGTIQVIGGRSVPFDKAFILAYWAKYGDKLDAYLLQGVPEGHISAGVRFGADGPEYLSPYIEQDRARALLLRFTNGAPR